MIRALILSVALTSIAPVVMAQDVVKVFVVVAEADALAPGEAEFEARAEVFGERMQAMADEMSAAITAAAGDAAKQDADLDAIEARYQADADAFAADLTAFVTAMAEAAPEEERAGMTASIAGAVPQIRSIPASVRSGVEQAATAGETADDEVPAPAPTTP